MAAMQCAHHVIHLILQRPPQGCQVCIPLIRNANKHTYTSNILYSFSDFCTAINFCCAIFFYFYPTLCLVVAGSFSLLPFPRTCSQPPRGHQVTTAWI